jgi:hypothetical protein
MVKFGIISLGGGRFKEGFLEGLAYAEKWYEKGWRPRTIKKPLNSDEDNITLCPHCRSKTRTIGLRDLCGECGLHKRGKRCVCGTRPLGAGHTDPQCPQHKKE